MRKSKDKRIRKLNKKRIWPSVLGLIVLLFVFFIVIVMVLASACMDVVQRKLSQASGQSINIAKQYEEYDQSNAESINEKVLAHVQLSTELEAVSLLDENGEKLWSSDRKYPVIDDFLTTELVQNEEHYAAKVVIEDEENQVLNVENGNLVYNNVALDKLNFEKIFDENAMQANDETTSIIKLKVWVIVPVEDMQVCILNNIYVYSNDMLMLVMVVFLFLVLILIFALYYLISVVSVIMSMRRTTKIMYTDVVTGGDNWLHFVKKSTTLLKKNRKNKYNYAMIHLKMRKYRSFCTCLGVREGEELIEKFYNVLKKNITNKETVAHHENAGFGLLLTYNDKEQLIERIEQLEKTLDAVVPNMKIYFGAGVYQIVAKEGDVEQMYNNALLACDMLGEEAENQTAFYDVEMNKQKIWERKVENDMERALANREFKVYLQPKISTVQEELAGAEALVRWIHPTEGFIPPNKFIPIFEKNGFILRLDDYMLREIARQQAQWMLEGRKLIPISVNISRAHFAKDDLADHICSIVDKFSVPHEMIELELTESAFFDDKAVLLRTVKKLKKAGFIVSMDDFGAGYSSLNSLKELNIDVLKIDADFFRGTDVEERGMLIVSEVIDLAKKLDMKIVAEGIENREQVDFLAAHECDLIQGYFYAKPMPIDEFIEKYN